MLMRIPTGFKAFRLERLFDFGTDKSMRVTHKITPFATELSLKSLFGYANSTSNAYSLQSAECFPQDWQIG